MVYMCNCATFFLYFNSQQTKTAAVAGILPDVKCLCIVPCILLSATNTLSLFQRNDYSP